jgi:hypothetical protein
MTTINAVSQHIQGLTGQLHVIEQAMINRRADENLPEIKPDNIARMRVARALELLISTLPPDGNLSYLKTITADFIGTLPKICRDEFCVEIPPAAVTESAIETVIETAPEPVAEVVTPEAAPHFGTLPNVGWTDEDVQSLKRFTLSRYRDENDSSRHLYEAYLDSDYLEVLNNSRTMMQAKRKVRAIWKEMNVRFAMAPSPSWEVETEGSEWVIEPSVPVNVFTLELPSTQNV